jgi:hypothetical protein
VEHLQSSELKRFILILMTIHAFGCKSQMSSPHEVDPIYRSLHEDFSSSEAKLAAQKKSVEDLRVAYNKTEPLTYERVVAKRDLESAVNTLTSLEQENTYLKLRMDRREAEDRINYKKAFREDKPWPDPNEYSAYLVNQRLLKASKNWSERVPKLEDRIKEAWKKPDVKKAGEKQASQKGESEE